MGKLNVDDSTGEHYAAQPGFVPEKGGNGKDAVEPDLFYKVQ